MDVAQRLPNFELYRDFKVLNQLQWNLGDLLQILNSIYGSKCFINITLPKMCHLEKRLFQSVDQIKHVHQIKQTGMQSSVKPRVRTESV